jgi:hypothetical protein
MATKKRTTKSASGAQTPPTPPPPDQRAARFKEIGQSSSQIVKDAALLLDDEIASGIVAAKQMQQRFQRERRVNAADFKDALTKFQGDAHEVINQLNGQFPELSSKDNTDLVRRFTNNTHALLDLVVELVNTGAELVDQLAQSKPIKK